MLGVGRANHTDFPFATDDFAFFANALYGWSNFHFNGAPAQPARPPHEVWGPQKLDPFKITEGVDSPRGVQRFISVLPGWA